MRLESRLSRRNCQIFSTRLGSRHLTGSGMMLVFSGRLWGWAATGGGQQLCELNLNPEDRRLRLTLDLAARLRGALRHLSQHPGGFVLTHDRLDDLVPVEPAAMAERQIIELDKEDIGPASVAVRAAAYINRPSVRMPRVISSQGLNVCGDNWRNECLFHPSTP